MSRVLDKPRELTIGGHVHQVCNYSYLVDWIEIEIEVIQAAEAELVTNPDEAQAIWQHIATHARDLDELLAAQEQWLADDDAALAEDANNLRAAIRNLPSSSYKDKEAGGS